MWEAQLSRSGPHSTRNVECTTLRRDCAATATPARRSTQYPHRNITEHPVSLMTRCRRFEGLPTIKHAISHHLAFRIPIVKGP